MIFATGQKRVGNSIKGRKKTNEFYKIIPEIRKKESIWSNYRLHLKGGLGEQEIKFFFLILRSLLKAKRIMWL